MQLEQQVISHRSFIESGVSFAFNGTRFAIAGNTERVEVYVEDGEPSWCDTGYRHVGFGIDNGFHWETLPVARHFSWEDEKKWYEMAHAATGFVAWRGFEAMPS